MTQAQIIRRQKAIASAVGSLRAEGLKPSAETLTRAKAYAEGKITIDELSRTTLGAIKNRK
jgi:antitoxin VbhA-like protein